LRAKAVLGGASAQRSDDPEVRAGLDRSPGGRAAAARRPAPAPPQRQHTKLQIRRNLKPEEWNPAR
jgi:hypothetical protein